MHREPVPSGLVVCRGRRCAVWPLLLPQNDENSQLRWLLF